MISRSQPGPGQLFPSSGLPTLLTIYPQLNLAQAKTIKGKFSNVAHTHTHIISTCVCVCACASYIIHDASPALEPMSCDRRSSTGIHNDACQLPPQFIALAYGCVRPSIRLGIDSEPGLSDHSESPLLSPSLSSSIHNVQQVHLNIQFQLAIPFPDFSFPSLFSSTSSPVFSFCFFKRINTRARTKNA